VKTRPEAVLERAARSPAVMAQPGPTREQVATAILVFPAMPTKA